MKIEKLSISPVSGDNSGDHDQLLFRDKVAYASFVLTRQMGGVGINVEFKGRRERDASEEEHVAQQRQ